MATPFFSSFPFFLWHNMRMQTQRVGNDRPQLLLKTIDAKSSSLK